MSDPVLTHLCRDRRALHALCLDLCKAFAYAHVHHLPTAAALRATMDARYDELAALDLALASYDPQQGLFPDDCAP